MNTRILRRLLNYSKASVTLDRLKRRTDDLVAQEQYTTLVRETFQFANGFLAPIQVEEEIVRLLGDVRAIRPKTVLEIGTSMGGTLFLWCRVAHPDATIISVDLPGGKYGGGYSELKTPLYKRFKQPGQKLHLMRANSHHPDTLAHVKQILDGASVDFMFLDGDHSYEGVRQDWEQYRTLMRPGGLVAFHDVASAYKDTQVKVLWDQIKSDYTSREYLHHPKRFYGIGVVVMP